MVTRPQNETTHTIVALVEDSPGVLARIVLAVRRRGFNIVNLCVAKAEQEGISRMTFLVSGRSESIATAAMQMGRLVEVIEVNDITDCQMVWRELALIKVNATKETRAEVSEIASLFHAHVIDIGMSELTFEITGETDKIDSMVKMMRPYGIKELIRTGRVATLRDSSAQTDGSDAV